MWLEQHLCYLLVPFVFPSKNKLLLDKQRLGMRACYAELLSAKEAWMKLLGFGVFYVSLVTKDIEPLLKSAVVLLSIF